MRPQTRLDALGRVDELVQRHVRAAHEAQLRLGVAVFPHARVALAHAPELRIVDDVHRCAVADERLALLHGLGREVLDVVQTDCTVGRGGCAKVLEIGFRCIIQLPAQPFVQTAEEGDILHDLHADG